MTLGFFSGSGLGISGARKRRTATGGDGTAGADGSSGNGASKATEPEDEGANVGEGAASFGKTSAPGKQKPGGGPFKLGRGVGGLFPGKSGGNPFVIAGKRSGRYTKGDLTIGESAVNQEAIDAFDEGDPALTQAQRETARYQIDEAQKLRTAAEIDADARAAKERARKDNRGP